MLTIIVSSWGVAHGARTSREARQAKPIVEIPNPRTSLPPPAVEMIVVNLLADFPQSERPYVQQVVHMESELATLGKECSGKATNFWRQRFPVIEKSEELNLVQVNQLNEGFQRYFDPLRLYLKVAYRRAYYLHPPSRFSEAHKYWLAYLNYALESLNKSRLVNTNTAYHTPAEIVHYRWWAHKLFKESGLDLTPFTSN